MEHGNMQSWAFQNNTLLKQCSVTAAGSCNEWKWEEGAQREKEGRYIWKRLLELQYPNEWESLWNQFVVDWMTRSAFVRQIATDMMFGWLAWSAFFDRNLERWRMERTDFPFEFLLGERTSELAQRQLWFHVVFDDVFVFESTAEVGRSVSGKDGLEVAQGKAMFDLEYKFWISIKKVGIM
jgi:hypothetical protein